MASGTTTLDFGAFPGASDASVAVTGQAAIVAGSIVGAWIRPVATADHTADEHMVETIEVVAGNISAGVGFTIYGFNTDLNNEPVRPPDTPRSVVVAGSVQGAGQQDSAVAQNQHGGRGSRLYGTFTVAWAWV